MIPIYKAYIYTIISAVSLFDDEDQPKKSSSETKRREESGGGEYIDEFIEKVKIMRSGISFNYIADFLLLI